MKHKGLAKGVFIIPNLLTTANLFCGFFSLTRAINGDFITAVWVLMLSGLFDFLDGRVARLTKGGSRFGMEYDSLVDLCSFGLTPALMMYLWVLQDYKKYGWTAAFLYFACTALRLARFNVQSGDVEKKNFQGLPSPAAAGCMISFILMWTHFFGPDVRPSIYIIVPMTVFLALLMVSNVRFKGMKSMEAGRRANFFFLVIMLGVFIVIASEPEVMLFVFGVCYVSFGIIAEIIRSVRHIKSFKDFMMRFFQADLGELVINDEKKKSPLKVVGINDKKDVL